MFTSRRDNGANVCDGQAQGMHNVVHDRDRGQEPEDDVAVGNINDDRNHMEITVQPLVNDSEVQGHIDPGNNRIHRINTGKKFDNNSRPDLRSNINCAIYENPLNEKTDGANRNTIAKEKHSPFPNTKRGAEENDDGCGASGVNGQFNARTM